MRLFSYKGYSGQSMNEKALLGSPTHSHPCVRVDTDPCVRCQPTSDSWHMIQSDGGGSLVQPEL